MRSVYRQELLTHKIAQVFFLKKHLHPTCTSLEPTPLADIAQERPNDNQLPTNTRIRYHATSA